MRVFGCVEEIGGDNRLEMRRYFCSEQGNVFPSGKIRLERLDLLLTVEYFAIASIHLPGKSEMSTQRFDGLCTTCNTLEARFELGGKLNPVLC